MVRKTKKKSVKKKKISKKATKSRVSTQKIRIEMQPVLVDNFVSLQKVMVNLADKLEDLSTKMQKLLDLFEISAKNLAKKDFKLPGESPEIIKKLDNLAEQNKVIARGITLMHEIQESAPQSMMTPSPSQPMPTPIPPEPSVPSPLKPTGEYKKSFKPLKSKKTFK